MSFVRTAVENLFNINAVVAPGLLSARPGSTPLVDDLPPQEAEPLVDTRFRPLPLTPPFRTELAGIPSRGHRKSLPRDLASENAQCPAGMEFRGHDQHAPAILVRQTLPYVSRFIPCRHALDQANADRLPWKVLNIFLRQLRLSEFVDSCFRGNIEQFPAAIALLHQLQGTLGTTIRFPCKHHNHVG